MPRSHSFWLVAALLFSLPGRARAEGPTPWPGPLRLSLSVWRGGAAWGGLLGLTVPLDVTAARPAAVTGAVTAAATTEPTTPVPERVTPERLRKLLRAAWRVAGVDETRLDDLASRARRAALLPEVQLRASRGNDQTLRTTALSEEELRAQATGQGSAFYEARLTLRLGRLVFADEEVAVERLRQEMQQQRGKVAQRLGELLGAWQRGQARATSAALPDDRLEAQLAAEAASVALDTLTDGAWSATRPAEAAPRQAPTEALR